MPNIKKIENIFKAAEELLRACLQKSKSVKQNECLKPRLIICF